MSRARSADRRAFTLLELLVVIAIGAILMGLLLAAVQKVRAAASRLQCANNLRQVGVAAHQYHDGAGSLPPGFRSPSPNQDFPRAGWLFMLLPYLEQEGLWRLTLSAYQKSRSPFANPPHVGLATVVPVFTCPADSRAGVPQFAPRDRIWVALSSYLGMEGSDLVSCDGVLFKDSRVRFPDVTDGLSNTLLAGERPASADLQFGWWYAGVGQEFTGSADTVLGVRELNVSLTLLLACPPGAAEFGPGSFQNQCAMLHFWSPHTGGTNFLFADGSVRFLTYDAKSVLPALATRAGGEVAETP